MIKELTKLANYFDSNGLTKEADRLDAVIRKIAEDECWGKDYRGRDVLVPCPPKEEVEYDNKEPDYPEWDDSGHGAWKRDRIKRNSRAAVRPGAKMRFKPDWSAHILEAEKVGEPWQSAVMMPRSSDPGHWLIKDLKGGGFQAKYNGKEYSFKEINVDSDNVWRSQVLPLLRTSEDFGPGDIKPLIIDELTFDDLENMFRYGKPIEILSEGMTDEELIAYEKELYPEYEVNESGLTGGYATDSIQLTNEEAEALGYTAGD